MIAAIYARKSTEQNGVNSQKGLDIWKGIGEIEPGGQRRLKGF
jgi:hypothetical protein